MTELYSRVLIYVAVQVFLVAFFISYFQVDPVPRPVRQSVKWLGDRLIPANPFGRAEPTTASGGGHSSDKKPANAEAVVMDAEELALFDGSESSKGLYLALLGKIYDVEKGRRHYGPDGSYGFFAGKDATRAFVTGDFTPAGLVDDVAGLSESELLSIDEWHAFYDTDYRFVGLLHGTYYDARGRSTRRLRDAEAAMERARDWKKSQKADAEKYPPCNSEWTQANGGRVWCTKQSGGVTRSWVGVPRRLFAAGGKQFRCACISDALLDNPNLKEYADCDSRSESCKLDG